MISIRLVENVSFLDLTHIAENMRDMDRKEIMATRWTDDPMTVVKDLITIPNLGYVFYWEDNPVAVVGATPVHPHVYSVFMFATDLFPKVAKSMTKFICRVIMPALVKQGCHRAHCLVLKEYTEVQEWLQFLGAIVESPLRHYGRNREDFVCMAWSPDYVLFRRVNTQG